MEIIKEDFAWAIRSKTRRHATDKIPYFLFLLRTKYSDDNVLVVVLQVAASSRNDIIKIIFVRKQTKRKKKIAHKTCELSHIRTMGALMVIIIMMWFHSTHLRNTKPKIMFCFECDVRLDLMFPLNQPKLIKYARKTCTNKINGNGIMCVRFACFVLRLVRDVRIIGITNSRIFIIIYFNIKYDFASAFHFNLIQADEFLS